MFSTVHLSSEASVAIINHLEQLLHFPHAKLLPCINNLHMLSINLFSKDNSVLCPSDWHMSPLKACADMKLKVAFLSLLSKVLD